MFLNTETGCPSDHLHGCCVSSVSVYGMEKILSSPPQFLDTGSHSKINPIVFFPQCMESQICLCILENKTLNFAKLWKTVGNPVKTRSVTLKSSSFFFPKLFLYFLKCATLLTHLVKLVIFPCYLETNWKINPVSKQQNAWATSLELIKYQG